jgi:4-hydroxy-3-methylbut-2-enyl diphosphate reductase
LAIVVGGYNSSNTSHLVELCEEKLPTFYIKETASIVDTNSIVHFDWRNKQELQTNGWMPAKKPLTILLTSGASCPDTLVQAVIEKLLGYFPDATSLEQVGEQFEQD